jgi:hypothetical protein
MSSETPSNWRTPEVREIEKEPAAKVKMLDDCDFPIEEERIGDFKVLKMPMALLRYFNEEQYGAIRINSAELAARLPDYGGGTAPGRSQIPHQDHLPGDRRRFLAFSKADNIPRGSSTYLVSPELARETLPSILAQFEAHREEIRDHFVYNPPYMVTKEELYQCFESGGIEKLIQTKFGENTPENIKLFGYLGVLTYLTQGNLGDEIVKEFLQQNERAVFREDWTVQGVLIIDNTNMFHGRSGPNVRIKRNWIVEP